MCQDCAMPKPLSYDNGFWHYDDSVSLVLNHLPKRPNPSFSFYSSTTILEPEKLKGDDS